MNFLVGGAIFRIAARKLHGRTSYGESMLVLLVAGAAFLLVRGLVSGTVDDVAVILAAAFPAGVLVGAAVVRRRVSRSSRLPPTGKR